MKNSKYTLLLIGGLLAVAAALVFNAWWPEYQAEQRAEQAAAFAAAMERQREEEARREAEERRKNRAEGDRIRREKHEKADACEKQYANGSPELKKCVMEAVFGKGFVVEYP